MEKISKTSKVVIYGDSDFAEQVYYQLESDGRYQVLAFTVDKSKYQKNIFKELPVIEFQKLKKYYSQNEVLLFPAIGYTKLNKIREVVMSEIEHVGFQLLTYISKNAFIGTNVTIGKGCFICEFVSIKPNTSIGNSVIIFPNTSIGHNVTIEDHNYFSICVAVGGNVVIKNNSFIGMNSTIKNSITIEEYNIIGSATNVIKSTTPNGIYVGNPAKRVKDLDLNNFHI